MAAVALVVLASAYAFVAPDPVAVCVEGNYTCDGECLADGKIVEVHEHLNALRQHTESEFRDADGRCAPQRTELSVRAAAKRREMDSSA